METVVVMDNGIERVFRCDSYTDAVVLFNVLTGAFAHVDQWSDGTLSCKYRNPLGKTLDLTPPTLPTFGGSGFDLWADPI